MDCPRVRGFQWLLVVQNFPLRSRGVFGAVAVSMQWIHKAELVPLPSLEHPHSWEHNNLQQMHTGTSSCWLFEGRQLRDT